MPGYTLKKSSRTLIRNNISKIIIATIIYLFLTTLMSELQVRLLGTLNAYERVFQQLNNNLLTDLNSVYSYLRPSGIPFAIVFWILTTVLMAGYKSFSIKIVRGLNTEYKDLFNGFLYFGKVILIQILISIFVALWSLLLIVPGIIALYRYRQAIYILLDDPDKSPLQCINESKELMRGKKLDMFLLDLSFLGWVLLDYIVMIYLPLPFSLPLISVYLTPYTELTYAAYYDRLIGRGEPYAI